MLDKTLEWMGKLAIVDGLLSSDEEDVIREYSYSKGIDCEEFLHDLRLKAELIETKVIPVSANVIKGIEFENYIFNKLVAYKDIKVLSRSADYKLGLGTYLDARSLEPDFLISHKIGKFKLNYWIECKYRSKVETLKFHSQQIKRYNDVQKTSSNPVFIIYGEGGCPSKPKDIYFFALDDIISETVSDISNKGNYIIKNNKLANYKFGFDYLLSNILNL